MNIVKGKFYTQFEDESVEQAVASHSIGYDSVEQAIADSNTFEEIGSKFKVLDSDLRTVAEGVVGK